MVLKLTSVIQAANNSTTRSVPPHSHPKNQESNTSRNALGPLSVHPTGQTQASQPARSHFQKPSLLTLPALGQLQRASPAACSSSSASFILSSRLPCDHDSVIFPQRTSSSLLLPSRLFFPPLLSSLPMTNFHRTQSPVSLTQTHLSLPSCFSLLTQVRSVPEHQPPTPTQQTSAERF